MTPSGRVPSPSAEVTRRAVLMGVAAGTLVAGCTIGSDGTASPKPGGGPSGPPRPDPDVALAAAALAGEQAALRALEETLARHREMRRTLSPVIEAHRAHVALLAQTTPVAKPTPSSANSSAIPSPGPSSGPSPGAFKVPGSAEAAGRSILALELALSASQERDAFAAKSGGFARLLASMAAAARQHAALLGPASSAGAVP